MRVSFTVSDGDGNTASFILDSNEKYSSVGDAKVKIYIADIEWGE